MAQIFTTLYEGPEIFTRRKQPIDDDWLQFRVRKIYYQPLKFSLCLFCNFFNITKNTIHNLNQF